MKCVYLHKNENSRHLLLFFGGWGTEPSIFGDFVKYGDCDVLMCYDYTSMDFEASKLQQYETIDVLAWSLGVWVAATILGKGISINRSVAVNGTIYPQDDSMGIPVTIFEGTISNFSHSNYSRFLRRMCGSKNALAEYESIEKQRKPDGLLQELVCLQKYILSCPAPGTFHWDMALIGSRDMIFPSVNQCNAWNFCGVPYRMEDISHYGKSFFAELLDHENLIWKRF